MPLISCKECQHQISDTALSCPQCGAPVLGATTGTTSSKRMSTGKKVLIGAGIIFVLPLVGTMFLSGNGTPSNSNAGTATNTASTSSDGSKITTKWEYSEEKDAMGTINRAAELESENTIDQQAPYSTTHGYLTIRSAHTGGANIMFHIENGQILCHAFMNDTLKIKVDDKSIEKIRCAAPSDGDSKYAFIESEKHVLSELVGSKRVVIEPTVYQAGSPQFVFSTAGLTWDR